MKISKLFHTLYGCLMALPILVIPIFAININQKSVEPISIQVQEKISVDFNQLINYENNPTYFMNGITYTNNDDGSFGVDGTATSNSYYSLKQDTNQDNHKYLVKGCFSNGSTSTYMIRIATTDGNTYGYDLGNGFIFQNNRGYAYFLRVVNGTYVDNLLFEPQLYDLTQMGLEDITVEEFNTMFSSPYYDYTESQNMLINNPTPTTYNDTDIGSQFLYSIYKPVNDYFNFKDFMGLGSLYDWIQLNIFSGSNSLVFFILFNLFTYWIFVSFFWLIFDVLMYVPSLVHKMLDKARLE